MDTSLAAIVACSMLHNICIDKHDHKPTVNEDILEDEVDAPEIQNNPAANTGVRQTVINTVFE